MKNIKIDYDVLKELLILRGKSELLKKVLSDDLTFESVKFLLYNIECELDSLNKIGGKGYINNHNIFELWGLLSYHLLKVNELYKFREVDVEESEFNQMVERQYKSYSSYYNKKLSLLSGSDLSVFKSRNNKPSRLISRYIVSCNMSEWRGSKQMPVLTQLELGKWVYDLLIFEWLLVLNVVMNKMEFDEVYHHS